MVERDAREVLADADAILETVDEAELLLVLSLSADRQRTGFSSGRSGCRSRSRSHRAIDWKTCSGVLPPIVRLTAVMPDDCEWFTISGVSASTFTGVLNGPGLARKSMTVAWL